MMARGTFANVRLVNKLLKEEVGPKTISVSDAESQYKTAGAEYGSGSPRDWAAKGPLLSGVKAVTAKSLERTVRYEALHPPSL
ncbi:unnamed protein product [Eruca vesicaria subsp. sativa]|uniref:Aconitase A/isopropylmalate dehydratase small subunit swivel domain-containing protein n=1 Tax=Eruca vesicaria subsp. sativa TaxID=29727 RepID=A0ABC8J8K3_ERUVS|nr:unnamed protein product [Eruca vesicaria subsp. sativa]